MFTFYCAGILWYHVAHTLLYTNPVTLSYFENMGTNQEATSTSDTQAVNACTCARISEPTTVLNLNFVEEQENGARAKSRGCVLLKIISKCNLIYTYRCGLLVHGQGFTV